MSSRWLLGLVVFAMVLAACGTSASGAATTKPSIATTPVGWTSHNYGRATISTPKDWVVQPVGACVMTSEPTGVLIVGAPVGFCQSIPAPSATVTIENLPADENYRRPPFAPNPITVNGMAVYVKAGPPGTVLWAVPALGMQVVGTGPGAGRVLHTLGRPVSTFGSAYHSKVILKIGDGCLPAVQWFDAHTASTIPGKDSVIAASCTQAELAAVLKAMEHVGTPQSVAGLERFIVGSLCPKYATLKLCTSGS